MRNLLFYLKFNLRLEDVYTGILAKQLNTTIIDILPKFVPYNQYDYVPTERKISLIYEKKVENVLFVYEKSEFELFWNILANNRTK